MSEQTPKTIGEAVKTAFAALNPFMNEEQKQKFSDVLPTEEAPAEDPQKFVEANLADGTVVNIEPAVELGATVMIVTEEGETQAPDGSHTLEDGTVITTEGGVIIEVNDAAAEEEGADDDTPEDPAAEEMAADGSDDNAAEPQDAEEAPEEFTAEGFKRFKTTIFGRVDALEGEVKSLKKKLADAQKMSEAVKNSQIATADALQLMSSTPTAEPTTRQRTPFASDPAEKNERIAQIAEGIKKLNEK